MLCCSAGDFIAEESRARAEDHRDARAQREDALGALAAHAATVSLPFKNQTQAFNARTICRYEEAQEDAKRHNQQIMDLREVRALLPHSSIRARLFAIGKAQAGGRAE